MTTLLRRRHGRCFPRILADFIRAGWGVRRPEATLPVGPLVGRGARVAVAVT